MAKYGTDITRIGDAFTWQWLFILLLQGALHTNGTAGMLTNAGFESAISTVSTNDTLNWYGWGSALADTQRALTGTQALAVRGSWAGFAYGGCEQKVAVQPGTDYMMYFSYMFETNFWADQREVEVDWLNSTQGIIRTEQYFIALEGNPSVWHKSGTYYLRAPSNSVQAEIRFDFGSIGIEDTFFVDEVYFQEHVPETYALENRSFERPFDGQALGNWIVTGAAKRTSWQARSGNHALTFEGRWGGYSFAQAEQIVETEPERVYHLRFFHYWDTGFTTAYRHVELAWYDHTKTLLTNTVLDIDLSAGESVWHQAGPWAVTSPAQCARTRIRFMLNGTSEGGTYYVDDMTFREPRTFFRCAGTNIVDRNGDPWLIRGLAFSGWFFPEAYMFGIDRDWNGPINTYTEMRNRFEAILGSAAEADLFWDAYTSNFLTAADVARLAGKGINTVRIPFNYRELSPQNTPGAYDTNGFAQLDRAIAWCRANDLYAILDMHSCPGGQASEPSGDAEYIYTISEGGEHAIACLWESNASYHARTGRTPAYNVQRTADIWHHIANRYRDEEYVLGYELINEPHLPACATTSQMRQAFIKISDAVRQADPDHIFFVEGDWFAEDIGGLTPPWDNNMAIAFHRYWKTNSQAHLEEYLAARDTWQIPLWLSESGENSNPWFYELVTLLESNNIGWTWWGWKKMDSISSGWSARIPSNFQYCIDHLWEDTVDPLQFKQGLMDLADAFRTEQCDIHPGYLTSLLDPEFGIRPLPWTRHTIPGIIHAVEYDVGNEGQAYHDTRYRNQQFGGEPWNNGWAFRNDGVDINTTTNNALGYKVFHTDAGEWLQYTVDLLHAGVYRLIIEAAATSSPAQLQLSFNGSSIGDSVTLPASSGWEDFSSSAVTQLIDLSPGSHTLRVEFVQGGIDLSSMIFQLAASAYVDHDGDIMDDHWEICYGGDLQPMQDDDGDGILNLHEYYADTQPTNASSFFDAVLSDMHSAPSCLTIAPSSTNRSYTVLFAQHLMTDTWSVVQSNVTGTGNALVISNLADYTRGYYRIQAKPRK